AGAHRAEGGDGERLAPRRLGRDEACAVHPLEGDEVPLRSYHGDGHRGPHLGRLLDHGIEEEAAFGRGQLCHERISIEPFARRVVSTSDRSYGFTSPAFTATSAH